MRGFFGIGVEGIHKAQNVGSLVRTAHAFGASFFYTIAPELNVRDILRTDTSGSFDHLPYFEFERPADVCFPKACQVVGVELTADAIELPSFRHPTRAAYVLGPEMGNLSPAMLERCDFVIKIPTSFCVNVGVAGAIVIYDRMISMGRYAERPVKAGAPISDVQILPHGKKRKVGPYWV